MKQVALVTGGSRGIGYGIAHLLAQSGYNLVINGVRHSDVVAPSLRQLEQAGAEVLYFQGDISSADARVRMLKETDHRFGRLDVLVNNAGMAPRERNDILQASEESFSEVMDTNLKGPYFLTQAVANWMIAQQQMSSEFKGCIINISSISSTVASVNRGEYCISKAGVSMATKLFAVRLAEYKIPVYEVQPGIIGTDMTSGVTDKYSKLINEGLTVQKRWGTPEDVGKAVLALVLGYLPYSTGQVLMVDGGLTIPRL